MMEASLIHDCITISYNVTPIFTSFYTNEIEIKLINSLLLHKETIRWCHLHHNNYNFSGASG